jgi:hypothetical protein
MSAYPKKETRIMQSASSTRCITRYQDFINYYETGRIPHLSALVGKEVLPVEVLELTLTTQGHWDSKMIYLDVLHD